MSIARMLNEISNFHNQCLRNHNLYNGEVQPYLSSAELRYRLNQIFNKEIYNYDRIESSLTRVSKYNKIHWISFLNNELAESTRAGYFISIYIKNDKNGYCIALSQGYSWIKDNRGDLDTIEAVKKITRYWQNKFNIFTIDGTNLEPLNDNPTQTNNLISASVIYYQCYSFDIHLSSLMTEFSIINMLLDKIKEECEDGWQNKNLEILGI